MYIGNSLDYNDLFNQKESLNNLKQKLELIGLKPKDPIIALCQRVS